MIQGLGAYDEGPHHLVQNAIAGTRAQAYLYPILSSLIFSRTGVASAADPDFQTLIHCQ